MNNTKSVGSFGEKAAAEYLMGKGYLILERNYSCRYGEIDIIAQADGFLVFAEVKTRKNAAFAQAREYVSRAKQQRILTTAQLWLSEHGLDNCQPRFDVIEVYAPHGGKGLLRVNHIEDAFM